MPEFSISPPQSSEDLAAIKDLFLAYAAWLGLDLTFQGFDEEVTTLPGKYELPWGQLFLARWVSNGSPIGCIAIRRLSTESEAECEMKRLYVSPDARGSGLGIELVKRAIETAKDLGYQSIKLDTLPHMKGAIALYRKAGFKDCAPYYDTPLGDTIFLEMKL